MDMQLPKVRWRHLWGESLSELLGAGWEAGLTAADQARIQSTWQEAVRSQGPFEVEYRVSAPHQPDEWLLARAATVTDPLRPKPLWVGILVETTRWRNAETAQRHLTNIIQQSHDAVFSKDLNGQILSWNPAAAQLFGFTAEEMIGRSITALIPPGSENEESWILEQIKQGKAIERYETVRRHKDGHLVPVVISVSPLRDEAGTVVGASKTVESLSERRSAERRFRIAVESCPSGMILTNPAGEMLLVNNEVTRLFGYTQIELVGQRIEMLLPERYRGSHPGQRGGFFAAPAARRMGAGRELYGRHRDGHEFPVEIGLNPVESDEGLLVLAAIVDITDRKKAQQEILALNASLEDRVRERTEALEIANRDLESFSYSVAHDLRAPLRHISGYSQLLVEESNAALNDEQRMFLDNIQSITKRLGVLIDELLAFSRNGRGALNWQRVKLGELLDEARHDLQEECAGRKIDWQFEILPEVDCDRVLLKQVFVNLLSNALKYSRTRDRSQICVKARTEPNQVVCQVTDNGAGFDMQYAGKLFGVFQRLHREKEFEGIGIGLANVRRIVERHGGRVWAQSRLNEGASFFFSLPLCPEAAGGDVRSLKK